MMTKDDIELFFRMHYVAMYRLSMLILRDDDVARDIVHDVFEILLVSRKSDVSAPYLLTAVHNRLHRYFPLFIGLTGEYMSQPSGSFMMVGMKQQKSGSLLPAHSANRGLRIPLQWNEQW